jgi:hypothetical protein
MLLSVGLLSGGQLESLKLTAQVFPFIDGIPCKVELFIIRMAGCLLHMQMDPLLVAVWCLALTLIVTCPVSYFSPKNQCVFGQIIYVESMHVVKRTHNMLE